MKPQKRVVTYNGRHLINGTPIKFRNGQHTDSSSPHWGDWQTGQLRVTLIRHQPYKQHPSGPASIAIEGAFPEELSFQDWDENHKAFNVERFLVEIPDLEVIISNS